MDKTALPPILNREICIILGITNQCNFDCPYCTLTNQPYRRTRTDMEEHEWYEAVRLIHKRLGAGKLRFHLAGGEVFLKPWVPAFIEWMLSLGIKISSVTNGLSLPSALLENPCFKSEQFSVCVSIDGAGAVHEKTRKNYARVKENFERILAAGLDTVVMTTVHRQNLYAMEAFHREMEAVGQAHGRLIYMGIQPVISFSRRRVQNFGQWQLDLEQYLAEGNRIHALWKEQLKYAYPGWRFVKELRDWREEGQELSLESIWYGCTGGYGFGIEGDGAVVPCEMDEPRWNIRGWVNEAVMDEILTALEKMQIPNRRCLGCPYAAACCFCRLQIVHGYVEGFGYKDCQTFYRDILAFYRNHIWNQIPPPEEAVSREPVLAETASLL